MSGRVCVLSVFVTHGLDMIYTHSEVVWEVSAAQTPYLLLVCVS